MQITDRMKDLIKSGGEWISSIELENSPVGDIPLFCASAWGSHDSSLRPPWAPLASSLQRRFVRVLEIPTPRWTTYDAAFFGIDLSPHGGGVPGHTTKVQ